MSPAKTFPDGSALKRYELPSIDGLEGWATIVLGADGFFAAVTDYGNYAYRWCHTGDDDFRNFVVSISGDYLLGKVSRDDVYDGETTARDIKRRIRRQRREGWITKDEARTEWELVESCDVENGGEHAFGCWYEETNMCDASKMRSDRYPNDATAFAEKTLPRLKAMLRAELAAESKAA
jgi:hypothetical protein